MVTNLTTNSPRQYPRKSIEKNLENMDTDQRVKKGYEKI